MAIKILPGDIVGGKNEPRNPVPYFFGEHLKERPDFGTKIELSASKNLKLCIQKF